MSPLNDSTDPRSEPSTSAIGVESTGSSGGTRTGGVRTAALVPARASINFSNIDCTACGIAVSHQHHCKIQCPNCGYTRDCSDP